MVSRNAIIWFLLSITTSLCGMEGRGYCYHFTKGSNTGLQFSMHKIKRILACAWRSCRHQVRVLSAFTIMIYVGTDLEEVFTLV